MSRRITAVTPAKINFGLEVLGRRADGYHDIVTILQTITIYDRLTWQDTGGPFQYRSPQAIGLANDLVTRALELVADPGMLTGTLTLAKSIPESAGLGGGSSDAALALKLASGQAAPESLHEPAATLGSDVPFFLHGGTAIARGTGVDLTPLPTRPAWVVLVSPKIAIPSKTRTLYQSIAPDDFTDGSAVEAIACDIKRNRAFERPLPNAFRRSLMEYSPVRAAADALEAAGAPWVSVSGAGPTLFTLVATYTGAATIARRIPPQVGRTFLARTLSNTGYHAGADPLALALRNRRLRR